MSTARVSRNELCPCRSGKKYKHCCLLTGRNSPVAVLDGPKSNRISALFPLAGLSSDRPTLRQEWKELHLDVPLRDGTGLHIVLFHSECWLRDQRVGVGHGMDVNLPQISYQGAAILTAVQTAEWAPSAEGELKAVFHRTVDNDGGVLVLGARRTRSRGNFAERCANLRLVSVEFTERRGPLARQVNLELLRPISWIRQQNVRVGGTVVLDEPKEGVQGRATVRAIHPCPSRKSLLEKMQVGEFKPWSCRIGDLKISSESQPIGVTAMHPFWSPDQRRWISAGRLEPGDLVYTDKGTAVVEWYVMREKPVEAVCNIEVEGDHVYRVGESAVLVHNSSALSDAEVAHRVGGGDPGNLTLKPDETTLIPPGISVLIGGTPEQAAADMRRVFGSRSSMSRRARVVGTAEIRAIRAIGFDVMPDPTRNFPNHGRLYHPCGIEGFTPENLARLATVFVNTGDM